MLNQLAIECYENSKAHGFWDASSNIGEKITLMHSEVSEAYEEHRAGHAPNEVYFNEARRLYTDDPPVKSDKPEGIPIELADCAIRVLDFTGRFEYNIENAIQHINRQISYFEWDEKTEIGVHFGFMHRELSFVFDAWVSNPDLVTDDIDVLFEHIAQFMICLQDFCDAHDIDLEAAIQMKMEYNKTRPFMHNKVV